MKTAISVPDDLFTAADALAGRIGISRSELYATAVAEFLAKHDTSEVTARLDAVYERETSALADDLAGAQRASLVHESW